MTVVLIARATCGYYGAAQPCRHAICPPDPPLLPCCAVEGLQRFIPPGSQFLLLNGLVYGTRDFNLYSFLDALRREVRCSMLTLCMHCCACAALCHTAPCKDQPNLLSVCGLFCSRLRRDSSNQPVHQTPTAGPAVRCTAQCRPAPRAAAGGHAAAQHGSRQQ